MKKIISPSHSLNKKAFKQINIYSDPKKYYMPTTKIKSSINNITEICNSIYEDLFPYILKISKMQFFEKFNKEVDDIFLSGKYKSENIKYVLESKENIIKKYDKDFNYLNDEYENYLKNKNKYKYLTHFRKHCIDTDHYAFHYCSSNKKGKFIEIKNRFIKNNEAAYVICEGCKQCYLSKFILMLCNHCNRKYFSNILKEKEDGNILPATWKKYHCNSLVNAIMKCIKCRSTLYFNLVSKKLVCLNKKCNFNSKPESILWICNVCNKEFRSDAKIYNPLEFQILKKSINYALLKQIKAAPRELPCHCTKNLSKLVFYHKDECQGELYKGMLIDRPILVCNKCKAINFEDKFTWICPICKIKFHLHRVIGCKPFSKKKYIINKSFNKSARNVPKKKLDKELLTNNLLSSSSIYDKKSLINLNKSVNDTHKSYHSKLNPSEDMNNISTFNTNSNDNFINEKYFKKIENNKIKNDRNKDNKEKELTKYYDYQKRAWIINLKKENKKDISPNNTRHYKTLIDILKERMISDSGKEPKESNKFNKTMLPPQRIINRNIIKRRKDILNEKTDSNIINNTNDNATIIKNFDNSIHRIYNRTINQNINKKEKEEKKMDQKIEKKEEKKDKYLLKNKIFNKIIKIDDYNKGKNNIIKIKNPKIISSPFRSEISLKYHKIEENKKRNIFKYKSHDDEEKKIKNESNEKKEISNLPISKTLSTNAQNKKTNSNNIYNSLQVSSNNSGNFINSINSFRFWKRRGTTTSNENQNNKKIIRYSKINDLLNSNKYETEPSFNENNNNGNGLRDSSRNNMNVSLSSSFRFSFLGNNSILKPYNNALNNNINVDNNQKSDLVEDKKEINTLDIEKDDDKNDNNNEKKSEEESHYTEENYDKMDTLKEFMRKSKIKKKKEKENEEEKKEESGDKFNDSFLYEKKETCEEEEDEDEENKDIIKDIFIKSNAKKNFRESLMLKSNFIRQSILISQDKLNNLADKTDIPSINESDYSYIKPIGEGTYGVVYLVENNETSEQFALKKIICRDYNELIKQKSELELIFSVKHENILKLYGLQFKYLDETTSAIYVLMELAQNDWNTEIKRRIIAKRYYKEYELINLLKQIIKGFLFLQDKNIAHRDIKPQNILLFPNNVYKIADFGEAKFIKNIAEQSTLRGSELYMSPLLYKGYKYNQKNVLHNPFKSDVFSLGYCLLYAMCLNLKVLEVVRELNTMKSIISNINKFIVKNKYSDKLINIVYKMIEPSEDLRYDFEDLSIELEKL